MNNFKSRNIVDKYGDMIYHIALRRLKNEDDANDIVQEVFFKYIKHIRAKRKFKDEKHEKCWFICVSKNLCSNEQKKSYKKDVSLEEQEIVQEINFNEKNTEVLENVNKLKDRYRVVVELFYFNDFKISEISHMLKIREDTVRQRLSRGRVKLKEICQMGGKKI